MRALLAATSGSSTSTSLAIVHIASLIFFYFSTYDINYYLMKINKTNKQHKMFTPKHKC